MSPFVTNLVLFRVVYHVIYWFQFSFELHFKFKHFNKTLSVQSGVQRVARSESEDAGRRHVSCQSHCSCRPPQQQRGARSSCRRRPHLGPGEGQPAAHGARRHPGNTREAGRVSGSFDPFSLSPVSAESFLHNVTHGTAVHDFNMLAFVTFAAATGERPTAGRGRGAICRKWQVRTKNMKHCSS